jgi:S1-C subfamily serine protease
MRGLWLLAFALLVTPTFAAGAKASDPASRTARFERLSCAVVHISAADQSGGTGFFVNGAGRMATAAHVVMDRSYSIEGNTYTPHITYKAGLKVTKQDGTSSDVPTKVVTQQAVDFANTDLAEIETNLKTPCHLDYGDPLPLKVGDHLIAIGFPGSTPTGVLYEGFLSARHTAVHALGPIVGHAGQVLQNTYDVFRVQMPITAGASGSPLIDDDDHVIGVITEVPVVAIDDINALIESYSHNGPRAQILLGGFDTNKMIAELGYVVREFESPGSGLAVPIYYLKR